VLNREGSGNPPGPFVFPVAMFAAVYLAALYGGVVLRVAHSQWVALIAVALASVLAVAIVDRGRWDLGLVDSPVRAAKHFWGGVLFAVALIGIADLLILAFTPLHHRMGNGFPFAELAAVYLPAAVHEELLFRGYPFQKLWVRFPRSAIIGVSLLFAALHAFNDSVTVLALTNVFLGGVLLSLAYALYEKLWLPIGLHLAWNLMSGPVLGYGVSGFIPEASVVRTMGGGPSILTGGGFGIEGSVLMTAVEVAAIAVLWWRKFLVPQSVRFTA
jgi:membrane protease YdiL (CAAX protease family)